MSILSSILGIGGNQPQPVAGPMLGTSKIPEELAPYYKDILGKAQALYKEKTAEGFQPYQGPTIAQFTPEQEQAFTGLAGLTGQQAPVFQEAMDMTRAAAAPMTSEQVTEYMSPYQQAVVDIEKREAQKQYESQVVPQLAAKAATTGGFGGSRQAILEGMAADTQQRLLGDIQAKGSQQAYEDAVRRFQTDRQASGQAGAQLAQMAPAQFKAQLGEFGALQTVGEQRQRQEQTALDEAFRQYTREQEYPYTTLGRYQATVTGAPIGTTQFAAPTPPPPTLGQTLIGGLGTAAGLYGQFTGKNPLSLITGKKHGGGLSDLPVVNADNGTEGGLYRQLFGIGRRPTARELQEAQRIQRLQAVPGVDEYEGVGAIIDRNRDNRSFGEKISDIASNMDPYIDNTEILAKFPSKATNILGVPTEDIAQQFVQGGKQIVSNVAERLPNLGNVDATSMEDLSALAGLRETPIRPPEVPTNNVNIPAPQMPEQLTNELIKPVQPALQDKNIQAIDENYVAPASVNEAIALEQERNRIEQIQNERAREAAERMGIISAEQDAIAQAEKNYMDAIRAQEGKYDERLAKIDDERTRDQYGNLASFFSRMATATPRRGGLLGVVDAAMQVAPESIQEMKAVNKEARDRADSLQDSKDAAERLRLKEELGMKVSARERRLANEKIEREEKQFAQSLGFKYDELDASIQDSIRDAITSGRVDQSDFSNVRKTIGTMLGGDTVIAPDGSYTRIQGMDLTPGLQAKVNNVLVDALADLADSNNISDFYARGGPASSAVQKINDIISNIKEEEKKNGGNINSTNKNNKQKNTEKYG